jgi:hypothetical protein
MPPAPAFITKEESSLFNGVLVAIVLDEVADVSAVLVVDESVVSDELPLLLQDQTKAAEKQITKESNVFFIKCFLCNGITKNLCQHIADSFPCKNIGNIRQLLK